MSICSLGYRSAAMEWYDERERQFWFTAMPSHAYPFTWREVCRSWYLGDDRCAQRRPLKRGDKRPLIAYCLERATLWFSLKMALIVGTLLAAINHGQAIVTGHFTPDRLLPLCFTYCVPFAVAMYGQIQGKRQRDRFQAESSASAMPPAIDTARDEQSEKV